MNIFQSAGAGVTYFRRYSLSCLLGIVTDVDTDAAKQPLPNDRFEKALTAIEKGTIKKEQIINGFKLTAEQIKRLG
jgi:molecular chaperone GrpE (heat shock protein)